VVFQTGMQLRRDNFGTNISIFNCSRSVRVEKMRLKLKF